MFIKLISLGAFLGLASCLFHPKKRINIFKILQFASYKSN